MKKGKLLSAAIAAMLTIGGGSFIQAAESYTLDGIIVTGDKEYDRFGNVITEQSYYRTGGDVDVITSQTLEKRHYAQLGDALKSVPGVQVQSPGGYRGGEYGYTQTHSIVSINGDSRVVVMIDGRRMDNKAGGVVEGNSGSGSKAMVDINQITSMDNIDKIEVIKGPGASVYGADATGGVINIITKKGTQKTSGSVDFSAGSWKRYNYGFSLSGSNTDGKLKYFMSGRREMSGDSHYKDGLTGENHTWEQTGYRDDSFNARVDYDFNDTHKLTVAYAHLQGDDDYPLTAPYYKYINPTDWERIQKDYDNGITGDPKNPGYRNLWILWLGAYNAYNKNNYDVTYSFKKDHGMESFVRLYDQRETYWGSFGGGDGDIAPVPFTKEWNEWKKTHYMGREHKSWLHHLKNNGIEIQLGKSFGKHDVLSSWTFDKSKYFNTSTRTKQTSSVKRDSVLGYLQDKIHVTDRWEITPSLRYSYYSDFAQVSKAGESSNTGSSSSTITPSINTQFAFNDSTSTYLGYSKIYRPLRVGDYDRTNGNESAGLEDEKGDVWTWGLRKNISDKTSASIHYDYTNMSNAVARYSVWDKSIRDFKLKYVNAKEVKKSFNMSVSHKMGEHWTLDLNYSHANDDWKAKNGMVFDPDLKWADGNVNSVINKLRPQNTYTANLTYENAKFSGSLLMNYYTGLSRQAYTDNRFLVMDLTLNYDYSKNISLYGTVTNLTNEAWENTYTNYLGMGAWPQPGRAFMFGAKYKF